MFDSHHDHDHGAHNPPESFGLAFAVGTLLNAGFVIAEILTGIAAHSMALIADAGHNLGDVLGLVIAWIGMALAKRAPSRRYTYGLGRGTILAALLNAGILLISVGAIAVEAVRRLLEPAPVNSRIIMLVAALGILINGLTAWLFASGRGSDINIRAAFQHMAYDALVSVGVVAAGALILLTGWERIDPVVSLVIAGVILAGTWELLTDSLGLAMDRVPEGVNIAMVRDFVLAWPQVSGVHDLHVWPTSTTNNAMTVHVVTADGYPGDDFIEHLSQAISEKFGIGHITVQLEVDANLCTTDCSKGQVTA